MAPSAVDDQGRMVNGVNGHTDDANPFMKVRMHGPVDTMSPHDNVHFDPSLKPKSYEMKGTDPKSKVLFRDVNILDSTGRDPFKGDVYIEGEFRHAKVFEERSADLRCRPTDQVRRRSPRRR